MLILPETLPKMYQYKYELACLQDDANNWCLVEDQKVVGSDIKRYPADLCLTGNATWDADVCFEDGFDLTAVEPDDERLTSLYDKSVVSNPQSGINKCD